MNTIEIYVPKANIFLEEEIIFFSAALHTSPESYDYLNYLRNKARRPEFFLDLYTEQERDYIHSNCISNLLPDFCLGCYTHRQEIPGGRLRVYCVNCLREIFYLGRVRLANLRLLAIPDPLLTVYFLSLRKELYPNG